MKTRYFAHSIGFHDGTVYISHYGGRTLCHDADGKITDVSDYWSLKGLLEAVSEGSYKEIPCPVADIKKVKKVARRWRKVPMTDVRFVFRHRTVTANDADEVDFQISDLLRVEIKS